MLKFNCFTEKDINALMVDREGETKVGRKIYTCKSSLEESLTEHKPEFVILGIPESIGPVANFGKSGAENGWKAFLPAFLSMQANRFFTQKKVLLAGCIDTSELQQKADALAKAGSSPEQYRELVEALDKIVTQVMEVVFKHDCVPIVIGGGHNNAYPIIKALHKVKKDDIQILNIDPHADFRPVEGRHSGNPFSYAMHEKLISKYLVCGLHPEYNSEEMLKKMDQMPDRVRYHFFDEGIGSEDVQKHVKSFLTSEDALTGLEFDMDSLAWFPVSALTPFGMTVNEACNTIGMCASEFKPVYLHLPETAPELNKKEITFAGKALALIVQTFLSKSA